MLNKLLAMVRQYHLIEPGDSVVCAVSGGADSVALLFALYLLRDKLNIQLSAAHYNHHLRGEESDRDETFVRALCDQYDIPLTVGASQVFPGKKGLEDAARNARYAFFETLPGKIATAHTADDNAETVLLHLVHGTGLKGLGAIAPVRDRIIRPLLSVTRAEVEAFLREYHILWIQDSSNDTDDFLRNRLRHHVMPLLAAENPKIAQNLSAMALRLREDEAALTSLANIPNPPCVSQLRQLPSAVRVRALEQFLKHSGVKEPGAQHLALAESLVFSDNPSAKANFPGGITIGRQYDTLTVVDSSKLPEPKVLPLCGETLWCGWRIQCTDATVPQNNPDCFTVAPVGTVTIRSRLPGDEITLPGGTKSLKKLFIDRKIPAAQRQQIPVLADQMGVLAVGGIGPNLARLAKSLPASKIQITNSATNCF